MAGRIRRHWKGLTAAVIGLAIVLVVGVPYVYIHLVEGDQPAPLTLADATESGGTAPADAASPGSSTGTNPAGTAVGTSENSTDPPADKTAHDGMSGTWTVGSGSQAGYRVHETLAGQSTVAVGRTDAVTGTLTLTDSAITAAEITVQVADIASDNSQRDRQFDGRIMNTDQFPTATFTLTQPITFDGPLTADASTLSATGDLTLHGTTNPVTFPLTVQRTSTGLAATGTIDITYQDYGINNPSVGGFVSVGDSGTIEFLIVASRT